MDLLVEYCPNIQLYCSTNRPINILRHTKRNVLKYAIKKRDFELIDRTKLMLENTDIIFSHYDLLVIKYINEKYHVLAQTSSYYSYIGNNREVYKYVKEQTKKNASSYCRAYGQCTEGNLDEKRLVKSFHDATNHYSFLGYCLYLSHREGHTSIYEFLTRKYGIVMIQVLVGACEGGFMDVILKHEKDLDLLMRKRQQSNKLMSAACKGGHINVVKFLVDKGAAINMYNVYCACSYGHTELLEFLSTDIATSLFSNLCDFPLDIKLLFKKLFLKKCISVEV
jgi:hypothetical protein